MSRIIFKRGKQHFNILRIYTLSCLLFFIISIFNIYKFKVYDTWSLIVFYIYAGILWIGIKAGCHLSYKTFIQNNSTSYSTNNFSIIFNKERLIIIYIIYIASLMSFIYFLSLYLGNFNITSFGASIKAEFDDISRTKTEIITTFILFMGSAVYIIVIGSKDNVSRFTLNMSRLCLFLPGLRGVFLGRRFTLAVELLIFFFCEYESISRAYYSMDYNRKKIFRMILIVSIIVIIVFLYIFSQRIVYSPDTIFIATPGDTELRPFWCEIYDKLGNNMNVFAYVLFYAGHTPYAFSYSFSNIFPDFPDYWGINTFRVLIQLISNIFALSPSYSEMAHQVPGIGRYTGYAGSIISDFGIYLAPFISFLFGFTFGRIERCRSTSSICYSLYPIVQVCCVFAPVYFFYVGGLDQVVFWTLILSPLCLKRCRLQKNKS